MTAREEILTRVRRSTISASSSRQAEYATIPRHYEQRGGRDLVARIDLFTDRLLDYGCGVHGCAGNEIASSIGHILRERNKRRVLVTGDIPEEWLLAGFEFAQAGGLSYDALNEFEGVISRCALAIAVTGTIVLRHTPTEGVRALSLIPDYHLCCVFENQVEELVPEGIQRMSRFAGSPITTIAGPSATADIEMTRIKGVHGPRTLDVLLISDENAQEGAS